MISFDVKPLLTNVPLEYTIDLVLKRIYDNGELSTDITRNERNAKTFHEKCLFYI